MSPLFAALLSLLVLDGAPSPAAASASPSRCDESWVETGVAPDRVEITTPASSAVRRSQPICAYPEAAHYVDGDPKLAASFACR